MWSKCNFYLFIIYVIAKVLYLLPYCFWLAVTVLCIRSSYSFSSILSLSATFSLVVVCVFVCNGHRPPCALQVCSVTADKYSYSENRFSISESWNPLKLMLFAYMTFSDEYCDRRIFQFLTTYDRITWIFVALVIRSLTKTFTSIYVTKQFRQSESICSDIDFSSIFLLNLWNITKFTFN